MLIKLMVRINTGNGAFPKYETKPVLVNPDFISSVEPTNINGMAYNRIIMKSGDIEYFTRVSLDFIHDKTSGAIND